MKVTVKHRSPSQIREYEICPWRFWLKRAQREWERPSAASVQGTAVHEGVEALERSERSLGLAPMLEVFEESYERHINRLAVETPNWDFWAGSGPKYPPEIDIERRFRLGRDQTQGYWEWSLENGSEEPIWRTPDGELAVELDLEMTLGDVLVKGITDQVVLKDLKPHVRDLKTGQKPGDEFQLAVYAEAIRENYDTEILTGDYWMARQGKPTKPYELKHWSRQRLTDVFGEVDQKIKAEIFTPAPEPSKCWSCPVNRSCDYRA